GRRREGFDGEHLVFHGLEPADVKERLAAGMHSERSPACLAREPGRHARNSIGNHGELFWGNAFRPRDPARMVLRKGDDSRGAAVEGPVASLDWKPCAKVTVVLGVDDP